MRQQKPLKRCYDCGGLKLAYPGLDIEQALCSCMRDQVKRIDRGAGIGGEMHRQETRLRAELGPKRYGVYT